MMLKSFNPANGELVWEVPEDSDYELQVKLNFAKEAFPWWSNKPLSERISYLQKYGEILKKYQNDLALLISKEVGKPLWEAKTEVLSMINKIPISIRAYQDRCHEWSKDSLHTYFKPHGVVAVLGPFNFPGHLPSGHIVPALLAGNCVIFKPSELTPGVGDKITDFLHGADIPPEVFLVLQGGAEIGKKLAHSDIDGLYFTGSARTGISLNETFAKTPGKILALEMGGNNPLVVSSIDSVDAAAFLIVQSSFITSGQRCSAARRLIVIGKHKALMEKLVSVASQLKIGPYTDTPEPYMGPVIHMAAAQRLLEAQEQMLKLGAKPLLQMRLLQRNRPFVTPGIIDVTEVKDRKDEEYFGPLLQVIFVNSLEEAILEANRTEYGLTAGLLSVNPEEWKQFYQNVRAGVINWNAPLTGASSEAPFGGVKNSGNLRPSGYLSCDYCSYPVASIQNHRLQLPVTLPEGMQL